MGTVTGTEIAAACRVTLIDQAGGLWGDPFMLAAINRAIAQIEAKRPDAYIEAQFTVPVAGTQQTIPADGLIFMECTHNAAGGVMRRLERRQLDEYNPAWRSAAPGPAVYWTHDPRFPKLFEIYPPWAVGQPNIMLRWGAHSGGLSALSDVIPIDNHYQEQIRVWVLGDAYEIDSTEGNAQKVAGYRSAFYAGLGDKLQMQAYFSPKSDRDRGPRNATVDGSS